MSRLPKIDKAVRGVIDRIPQSTRVHLVEHMTRENLEDYQPSNTDGLNNSMTVTEYADEYLFQVVYDSLSQVYGID
jgi:hypothetical protein